MLLAVGVIFLMGWLARSGVISPNQSEGALRIGNPKQFADAIDEGGPLLFRDPLGGDRHRILQHLGDDPGTGWHAFDARRSGARSECVLEWKREARVFVDSCDGEIVEADGAGLPQYEVRIREGRLEVVFGSPMQPAQTPASQPPANQTPANQTPASQPPATPASQPPAIQTPATQATQP